MSTTAENEIISHRDKIRKRNLIREHKIKNAKAYIIAQAMQPINEYAIAWKFKWGGLI